MTCQPYAVHATNMKPAGRNLSNFRGLENMRSRCKYILICLLAVFPFMNATPWACTFEQGYDVTVYPEVATPGLQQDAIIYHFEQGRVTSRWSRRMTYSNGSRSFLTADLTGTFTNGTLKCEQTSEMNMYMPRGTEPPGMPDGLHMIIKQTSYITGTLNNQGKILGRVKIVTKEILSLAPNPKDKGQTMIWTPLPDLSGSPDEFMDLAINLPYTLWYASDNIIACGAESLAVRRILERIDEHWNALSDTIGKMQYPLAASQIRTLKSDILDLEKEIHGSGLDCEIVFSGLPTDDMMIRLIRLRFMMEEWKDAYHIVNEALGSVQTQLAETRRVLTVNVFKSIIKNYINWSNSVPTDVVAGLSQYSFITGVADFPRSGLGMYEESQKDTAILSDQFKTKVTLEALEPFYDKKRDYVLEQADRTTTLIRQTKPSSLEPLDRSLILFFSNLKRASWQESPVKKKAMEQLAEKRAES